MSDWPRSWPRTRSCWPWNSGPSAAIPDNPAAWLTATAKHKAIDAIRRERARDAKYAQLAAESDPSAAPGRIARRPWWTHRSGTTYSP